MYNQLLPLDDGALCVPESVRTMKIELKITVYLFNTSSQTSSIEGEFGTRENLKYNTDFRRSKIESVNGDIERNEFDEIQ